MNWSAKRNISIGSVLTLKDCSQVVVENCHFYGESNTLLVGKMDLTGGEFTFNGEIVRSDFEKFVKDKDPELYLMWLLSKD